ncbi:SDR family NAD(P)-dependent oxidoreductase [Blastococcus tunisiensis]|uniref:3-oxoacyl-[acyl-carrier protein] reductase n=1 Tax=Blastococcus tunisiensis TaxID=1798228 RepID=A0A1I2DYY5_9ACTN|nr:SDR family oxidoreductase [Blastococcus sp. DSM 46838]SFE85473.1 3-oxoacyl-[acyl-carrier protein] reductase [Blastococcus sp. DSM 46838]
MQLTGKVAVVTGAGRGLGQAYARALAAAGAAVVVNDLDLDLAEETVAAIRAAGGTAVAEGSAVGSTEAAEAIVATAVEQFGRLDVMVTNAGVLRDRSLLKMEDPDFDLVVETHLRGTFTCGRAAARQFKEQGGGGRLILIGSPAGQRASFGQTGYTASKAGIVGLTRTWAAELQRSGTTVNAVIPVALTRMVATIPALAELVEKAERGEPIPADVRAGGLGTSDDVAPLVVFLASDEAAGITGQAIGAGGDRIAIWSHPTEVVAEVREGGWSADALAEAFPTTFAPHLQDFQQLSQDSGK